MIVENKQVNIYIYIYYKYNFINYRKKIIYYNSENT